MGESTRARIDELVQADHIVLFMKGSKHFPMCGFSAKVVAILKELGADFTTVNVLADPEIRQGVKEYGNWPTIPQLYVGGELIGGCDIVSDLYAAGELGEKLGGAVRQTA